MDSSNTAAFIIALGLIAFPYLSYVQASVKGYRGGAAFVLGLVLGPIALLHYGLLPDRKGWIEGHVQSFDYEHCDHRQLRKDPKKA